MGIKLNINNADLLTDNITNKLINFNEPIYWNDSDFYHWFFDFQINGVWVEGWEIKNDFSEITVNLFN